MFSGFPIRQCRGLATTHAKDYKKTANLIITAWHKPCWQILEYSALFNHSASHSVGGHGPQTSQPSRPLMRGLGSRAQVNSVSQAFQDFHFFQVAFPLFLLKSAPFFFCLDCSLFSDETLLHMLLLSLFSFFFFGNIIKYSFNTLKFYVSPKAENDQQDVVIITSQQFLTVSPVKLHLINLFSNFIFENI